MIQFTVGAWENHSKSVCFTYLPNNELSHLLHRNTCDNYFAWSFMEEHEL